MHLNHDFYVVVGKQYRTENAYTGHQYIILYLIRYCVGDPCTTLFTSKNIKVMIQMHSFLMDRNVICLLKDSYHSSYNGEMIILELVKKENLKIFNF